MAEPVLAIMDIPSYFSVTSVWNKENNSVDEKGFLNVSCPMLEVF
jgi:hypothetical protein